MNYYQKIARKWNGQDPTNLTFQEARIIQGKLREALSKGTDPENGVNQTVEWSMLSEWIEWENIPYEEVKQRAKEDPTIPLNKIKKAHVRYN